MNAELSTQPNFRLDAPISNSITAAKDSAARVITNRDRLPSFQSEDTVKSNSVVAGRKLNESANPNFLDSPRDRGKLINAFQEESSLEMVRLKPLYSVRPSIIKTVSSLSA